MAPDWTLIQSPVSDNFNGISSSPRGQLRVAVGNGGKIVHFNQASPSGVVMSSGTTNDLFDVYVLSPDFAVAGGRDIILLWNGSVWSPIITNSGLYLPVWATPDRSTIIYNSFKDVYQYQPENYQVTGGWNKVHSGQAEKQLFGLDGVALDWVAVGAQPSADINDPNNDPYSLIFDGNSITENTSFAPEIRGMTDIAANFHFENRIFADGAEDAPGFCTDQNDPQCTPEPTGCSGSSPGECFAVTASLEAGGAAEFNLPSPPIVDVYLGTSILNWEILDPEIVDLVGYSVVVGNFGPDVATGVALTIVADGRETVKNIACPDFTHNSTDVVHKFDLNTSLAPGETKTCEFALTTQRVNSDLPDRTGGIYTHVYANEADLNFKNQAVSCEITTGTCTRVSLAH